MKKICLSLMTVICIGCSNGEYTGFIMMNNNQVILNNYKFHSYIGNTFTNYYNLSKN